HHEAPARSRKAGAMKTEDVAGEWAAEEVSNRNCGHNQPNRFGSVPIDEPVGKINNDAGEKPSFGRAQQETRAIKFQRSAHKTGEGGECAARNQSYRQREYGARWFLQQRTGNWMRT